eukprot:scaffold20903_cov99-Isochrysis_galbana.AAC.1
MSSNVNESERIAASQPHSQAFVGSSPSRQPGMVQPVVEEMLATVHAAGSSLFDITSDSTRCSGGASAHSHGRLLTRRFSAFSLCL